MSKVQIISTSSTNKAGASLSQAITEKFGINVTHREVSKNPQTDVSTLEILARDSDWQVRMSVARHSNTSASTLSLLARDTNDDIRWVTSENPNTPIVALERLAQDSDWPIRREVARHPNTPIAILEHLARDSNEKIQVVAIESLASRGTNPR